MNPAEQTDPYDRHEKEDESAAISRAEHLDWYRQVPQRLPSPHDDADPVRRVWQLRRLHFSGHRYAGCIDHALVCVTRKGAYETFLPPERPPSVRRYTALYEVDTDPHSFVLAVPVPSDDDSFEFELTADVTWRVIHPGLFVRSQERDVPALITRKLLPLIRGAGRLHPIDASAGAEQAVRRAVDAATELGSAEGLRVTCSLRLRRDADERSHQARLRKARHEEEASVQEHKAVQSRERYQAERRAETIESYESILARGGTAALALHLAAHPDETQLVLELLQADRLKQTDTQVHFIDQALERDRLEDHHLEESNHLVAELLKSLLRTAGPSEQQQPSLPPPTPPAVSPDTSKSLGTEPPITPRPGT
ncbi:hypothetical protein ACN2WE_24315 [Streptomyces sp. cg28]|uniref:hypothetical protein n=1 Tax=Streptomyces sp. cg28 TaxID=3403457 RepID=UPI003B224BD8